MNFNNHEDFSNQCTSILVKMKQCYHNDLSKECAVLSDSERANFFSEFDATSSFKKLLVKPKISKPLKKRMVDEDVYQVERVLNVRKQNINLNLKLNGWDMKKQLGSQKLICRKKPVSFL